MGTESYRRNSLNHFHAVGIAGTDRRTEHGWELLTFSSILKRLGHKEVFFTLHSWKSLTLTCTKEARTVMWKRHNGLR